MIPKVHKKGTSFKGAAAYLLHDVERALTSERVGWVETRNLPISDRFDDLKRGDIAWRLMAATAMDQDRIKQRAWDQVQEELPEEERQPYKERGGRKSKTTVMHITLSWAEHEAAGLTREDMVAAAESALATLGEEPGVKGGGRKRPDGTISAARTAVRRQFADEHQALIVCHNDGLPHVHILLNRVHPEHGVMLPTSKERLLLSRWAQEYEEQRGEILCDQRRTNNERRDQGDHWSQGSKDRARHLYELEASANDNEELAAKVREQQKVKDHKLAQQARVLRERNKRRRRKLAQDEADKRKAIRLTAARELKAARKAVRDQFEPRFSELYLEQDADRAAFALSEEKITGRISNAWKQVDWKGMLTTQRRSQALKDAFGLFSGGTHKRTEALRLQQQRERVELEKALFADLKEADNPIRANEREQVKLTQGWHLVKHIEAEALIAASEQGLRDQWKERRAERKQAWEEHHKAVEALPPEKRFGAQMIKPNERTKTALSSLERMKEAAKKRDRDRDEGRDEDRGR